MKYIEDFLCISATLGDAKATQIVNIDKLFLKFIWKCKWPRITKVILKNNNKTGGFTIRGQDLTKTYTHMVKLFMTKDVTTWEIYILINGAGSIEKRKF